MGKKPTSTFAHIAFGKDGSVRKSQTTLPDNKPGQEMGIGERLLEKGKSIIPENAKLHSLEENDNDLRVDVGGEPFAILELTEIRGHEFLKPLTQEEYDFGHHSHFMHVKGKPHAIEGDRLNSAILASALGKLKRHYAKPKVGQFWLVLWSGHGVLFSSHFQGGAFHVSEAIKIAREGLAKAGGGPFDKIIFFSGYTRPETLWPEPYDDPEITAPHTLQTSLVKPKPWR